MKTPWSAIYYLFTGFGLFDSLAPIVEIPGYGKVQGLLGTSRNGIGYLQYLGIPYGLPPVGERRFEVSVPAEPWEGIRQSTQVSEECMQLDAIITGEYSGNEDCLYLNVYTRSVHNGSESELLPVLFYIHGGGFHTGSGGLYGPKYWMDRPVVVVTMNYRLGVLGFLNTGDDVVRGNMGLKDQNLALKWVRDNIHIFRGDKNQVTLVGESAGAASVHYHIVSPLSKGLFARAIMQSGNIGCPWAFTRNPAHQAKRFGKILDCPTQNSTALVRCMKAIDVRKLLKPHLEIMSPVHFQDDLFVPSVEAFVTNASDTFLSENPILLLQQGNFSQVPIILGVTSAEGGLKTARIEAFPKIKKHLYRNWTDYAPVLFHFDPKRTNVSEQLFNFYLGNVNNSIQSLNRSDDEFRVDATMFNLTTMLSDGLFFHGTHWAARYHAKYAPVYLYYYSYKSKLPTTWSAMRSLRPRRLLPGQLSVISTVTEDYIKTMISPAADPKRFGACHGDDMLLLWNMHWLTDVRRSMHDFAFSMNLVQTFAMFISGEQTLQFGNETWNAIKGNSELQYMELGNEGNIRMIPEPFSHRMTFWDRLDVRNPLDKHNW